MSPVATVALSIGGGMLGLAAVFFLIAHVRTRMTREWVRTTGVVVDQRSGRADRGMTAIYPTFQWRDQHGDVHQHTSSVRQSLGPSPGTQVPVRYDPQRPQRAMIDSTVQSGRIFYGIAAVLAVLGVLIGGYLGVVASSLG